MKHLVLRLKRIGNEKIYKFSSNRKRPFIKVKCSCGVEKYVNYDDFRLGKIKSCGCLKIETSIKAIQGFNKTATFEQRGGYIHGDTGTQFMNIYKALKSRCTNKNNQKYYRYGARGIKNEWRSYLDFKKDMYESYLKHVAIYGKRNTSIDRIDNNGNYCKKNCQWATYKQQANNKG